MSNPTRSIKIIGLRKTNSVTARALPHSTAAGRPIRPVRAGRSLTAGQPTRPPGGPRIVDHPRSIDEWEHTIQTLVSSFEIAAQDTTGQIDLSYEATFDLRSTGLTLQWLSKMFRNHLAAIDVPEERDIAMKADFDAADTDQVTIHLLSAFRPAARRTARKVGNTPAAATPPVEHQDSASGLTQSDTVEVHTATGTLNYKLPLSLSQDTLSSMEVSEILSPSGKPNRALANNRRRANQLLGLQVGNQYRYPRFQFDLHRKRIHPLVEHAHRALECDLDPWGTLDWWFTDNALIGGERPVDRLTHGRLTEHDIDLMVEAEQLGMD